MAQKLQVFSKGEVLSNKLNLILCILAEKRKQDVDTQKPFLATEANSSLTLSLKCHVFG